MSLATESEALLETPGGGGFGPLSERSRAAVLADIRQGYVTPEAALNTYGITDDGSGPTAEPRVPSDPVA
jgi:N-methylhydantoinase B